MSLALTAYGIAQGYSLSKLCDYGSYSTNAENLGKTFARDPADLTQGYLVRGNTLPNNNDNQSAPAAPSITGSPFDQDRMIASSGAEVFSWRQSVSAPFTVTFERVGLSTLAVGSPEIAYVTGANGVGVSFFSGLGNRLDGTVYFSDSIGTAGSTQNLLALVVNPSNNTASQFFLGDPFDSSTGARGIAGMAFPTDITTIAFLTSTTPSFVGAPTTYALKVFDVASAALLSETVIWVFDASQYPTPQYALQSFVYLRGDRGGRILLSGLKRTDALNGALFVAEFDLSSLALSEVAVGEVKANSGIRATSLHDFATDFLVIYDTRLTSSAQMTRITLPPGSTADNGPVEPPPPPPPPPAPDSDWTRTVPGVETTWGEDCRPEATDWTENCRPPAVEWQRSDF